MAITHLLNNWYQRQEPLFKSVLEWELVQLELKNGSIDQKKKEITNNSFKSLYNKNNKKDWN
jgi:hypothetical protein